MGLPKYLSIFVLVFFFSVFTTYSIPIGTPWTKYGGAFGGHYSDNYGTSYNLILNKSIVIGQNFEVEPLVDDIDNDAYLEAFIYSGGSLSLIDLRDGSTINSYSTGFVPRGNLYTSPYVVGVSNKVFGLFNNGSDDVTFASFIINKTSMVLDYSVLISNGTNSTAFDGVGVNCVRSAGSDLCAFMNKFTSLYVDESLFFYLVNVTGQKVYQINSGVTTNYLGSNSNSCKNNNIVPAVSTSGSAKRFVFGYCVISFLGGGHQYLSAVDYNKGILDTTFGIAGTKEVLSTQWNYMSNPIITSQLGGVDTIALTGGYDGISYGKEARLMVLSQDANTLVYTFTTGSEEFATQPFFAKCQPNSTILDGYGYLSKPSFALQKLRFRFYGDDGNMYESNFDLYNDSLELADNLEQVGSADYYGDGTTEFILTLYNNTGFQKSPYIFSCNKDLGDGFGMPLKKLISTGSVTYSSVISDFNNNGQVDLLLSASGVSKLFNQAIGQLGTATYSLTSITPHPSAIVNRGQDAYYSYVVDNPDFVNIYSTIKCDATSNYGSFSYANAGDTSHSLCNYQTIGCKQVTVAITDNGTGRTFNINPAFYPADSKKSATISVKSYCGDGQCDVNENFGTCQSDCAISSCGDTVCQLTETISTCPIDCLTATCGNAICELKENFVSCPADCTLPTCGNGFCDGTETSSNCPYDNFQLGICGDGICSGTESFLTCPVDCTQITCGNHICDNNENTTSCPSDCTTCGNGVCEGLEAQSSSASYCVKDCPTPNLNLQAKLVDINSANPLNPEETQGLLPELYLGIQNFFSPILIPFIYLMVIISVVLIFMLLIKLFGGK